MSAKTPAAAVAEPVNLVALIDGINEESGTVIELADLVRAIGDAKVDEEDAQTVVRGLGVVGRIIAEKVDAIKEKADELYEAYVSASAGGAR